MPYPKAGESLKDYIHRFMGNREAENDFPSRKQRYAVARSMYRKRKKRK